MMSISKYKPRWYEIKLRVIFIQLGKFQFWTSFCFALHRPSLAPQDIEGNFLWYRMCLSTLCEPVVIYDSGISSPFLSLGALCWITWLNLGILLLAFKWHWKPHLTKLHCCVSSAALECQRNLFIILCLIEMRQGEL